MVSSPVGEPQSGSCILKVANNYVSISEKLFACSELW